MAQYFTLVDRNAEGATGRQRVRFYFARRNVGQANERTRIVRFSTWSYQHGSGDRQLQEAAAAVAANIARPRHRTHLLETVRRAMRAMCQLTGDDWAYDSSRSHYRNRRPRGPRPAADGRVSEYGRVNEYGRVHEYGYKPAPRFLRGEGEAEGAPYFGVELEIDDTRCNLSPNSVPAHVGDLFYCKSDGSLTNGVELVSHPGTAAYWNSRREAITALLRKLSSEGWKSHDAGTCGMHVHISRSAFDSSLHLYRFLHLVYRFPRFTLLVSQRVSRELNRWASVDGRQRRALKAKVGLPGGDASFSNGRREAVNMTRHTAEVRIFRGTLNAKRFYKNLQYCAAAVEYTRETKTLRRVTDANFCAWVAARPEYADLAEFLNNSFTGSAAATRPDTGGGATVGAQISDRLAAVVEPDLFDDDNADSDDNDDSDGSN